MRRFVLTWALGLPAVVGGIAWLATSHAERGRREWSAVLPRVEALQRSLDEVDTTRPILYGEELGGRAFDAYERVDGLVDRKAVERFEERRAGEPGADEELASSRAELVAQHADALAVLRAGAHHPDARFALDWEQGWDAVSVPRLLRFRALARVARLAAEQHLEAGRPDQAVLAWLDGLQLGRDLFHVPFRIVQVTGTTILDELAYESLIEQGRIERLPRAELERLATGLATLDASLEPTSRIHEAELVLFARTVERSAGEPFDVWRPPFWSRALFGFSDERMCADHIRRTERWIERLRATDGAPWPTRRAIAAAIDAETLRLRNPLTRSVTSNLLSAERQVYEMVARLRLVRAALEYRASGAPPVLADPFGGELSFVELEDRVRFASRGSGEPGALPLVVELERSGE